MKTLLNGLMIALVLMVAGCNRSLHEIHASEPRQAGTFNIPYPEMVACAKEQAQNEEWNSGTGMVESIESARFPMTRLNSSVYTPLHRTFLWDMTFQPTASGGTLVEYRDQWTTDRVHTHKQAWAVVERCAFPILAR